eukprot:TRINITY_DN25524_c0_g1_i1.p2 TRINITY_DN25524_c0_g1~~TRINITY_DN25524_c0_g1_i1.p2  ORF type:complete len:108 (-),score=24.81 TRINITY_DN25524_c0_g1_i1:42-365(-)
MRMAISLVTKTGTAQKTSNTRMEEDWSIHDKKEICYEEYFTEERVRGGKRLVFASAISGVKGIRGPDTKREKSFGGCDPLHCQRRGKCCLLARIGYGGQLLGCPSRC